MPHARLPHHAYPRSRVERIARRPLVAGVGVALALLALPAAAPVLAQQTQDATPPAAGATARCRDGTYSFSRHHSGTCSHHGGVAAWLETAAAPGVPGDTIAGPAPRAIEAPTQGAPACGAHCGTERWAVKTLSDSDRARVQLQPVPTTIEALIALVRPVRLPTQRRVGPVEVTVYQVEARLRALIMENDGDYHLVLASPRDSTITMIAEVPDPQCTGACASGFGSVYAQSRQVLLDHLNAPGGEARPLVRIAGVGFFDFLHGQRGVAPNGIELHPVLKVEFP